MDVRFNYDLAGINLEVECDVIPNNPVPCVINAVWNNGNVVSYASLEYKGKALGDFLRERGIEVATKAGTGGGAERIPAEKWMPEANHADEERRKTATQNAANIQSHRWNILEALQSLEKLMDLSRYAIHESSHSEDEELLALNADCNKIRALILAGVE